MLGRNHRFHGLHALDFVYKKGQAVRGPVVTLRYAHNSRRDTYRVAVVVSKKVSKSAVVRNRIRRRVYSAAQACLSPSTGPIDLVFTVYNDDVATMDAQKLQTSVRGLLQKANVVL